MPTQLENVFEQLDLRLFPDSMRELTMDCSCPDWEVPCKHLAAACYLLAESFDDDPFQILAWRGRGRDDLLDRLRVLRDRRRPTSQEVSPPEPPAPLADRLADFWTGTPSAAASTVDPPADCALDQLDPLIVAGEQVSDLLRPAYRAFQATD